MWGTEIIGDPILGKIAGAILLSAFVPYVLSILGWEMGFSNWRLRIRRTDTPTRPSRATWLIWFLMDLGVVSSLFNLPEAENTIFLALALLAGSSIVVMLAFIKGERGWTKIEKWCLVGAALATLVWLMSGSPLLALILYLVVDTFAYIPTIVKSYSEPESEERMAWLVTFTAVVVNVLAIDSGAWRSLDISALLFPIYLLIMDGIIIVLLFRTKSIFGKTR